ncbi:DUF6691 family protein [Chitinophaga caeni]|uniref:DUF6691 family protein n=1 Tax=Chitinophaga caeni TaxID=2029983 RepID=UPI0018E09048|nr:DUF6691 family protein [Chitinophaga caeni]
MKYIKFLLLGVLFGFALVKSEVMSWYRIQEMFRLESFHMYGIIGSAIVVGMFSIWIIKKLKMKSIEGESIVIPKKEFSKGNVYGGLIFGLGWGITGACPGPLFAQVGSGYTVVLVTIFFATIGTWVYGKWKERLPH